MNGLASKKLIYDLTLSYLESNQKEIMNGLDSVEKDLYCRENMMKYINTHQYKLKKMIDISEVINYFEDFYTEQDLTPLDLVDYIFDKDGAECFVDKYAHFITERYTEGRFAELCLIEKKIQVEI
jgi:hypothetical protein